MKPLEILATGDQWMRPLVTRWSPGLAIRFYSKARSRFLPVFSKLPPRPVLVPPELSTTLWGLVFRAPLLNAAGMFKNGEGVEVVRCQGAGAFLAGTTTHRLRKGNRKCGVALPFVPYPRSGAASNFLGLPNPGHRAVARRLAGQTRVEGFPLGASLTADPGDDLDEGQKLTELVDGLRAYADAGVDFLELNESCPNTGEEAWEVDQLRRRLESVADAFLARRDRTLPVIVKFSNDTDPEIVQPLVETLLELGFDGINFGNTSIDYPRLRGRIAAAERPLYDTFVERFRGGVSGRPLKETSLELARRAVEAVHRANDPREFHVVRTGGIESAEDVRRSLDAGVALCQWYTGYFEAFGSDGHRLYGHLYRRLLATRASEGSVGRE